MRNFRLQILIEVAIMAGLAYVLDLLPSIRPIPNISISFAMVPVLLVAFRWGIKAGLASGFLWGTIQVVTWDVWFAHPVQLIMEYFVAFTFVGMAGILRNKVQSYFQEQNKNKALLYMVVAIIIGSLCRYFWHFIAGFIFWAEAGMSFGAAVWYSLWVNGVTGISSAALCSFVLVLLVGTAPRLLTQSVRQAQIPIAK